VKLALASFALLAGCAQILGLEDTTLDRRDAAADAPNICDTPAFECIATTGRSVCGRLFVAGTGEPYRVADPTAQSCTTLEGPCGLTVTGQGEETFFARTIADRVAALVDDCGHFAILDLDPAVTDVAIEITGPDVASSARLVFDLPATSTTETGVAALVVPTSTKAAWAAQLTVAETEIATGYLVRYVTSVGAAVPMEEVRVGGATVGGPPTRPWASYFTGEFDVLDPTLTATTAGGTAFIATPATGMFRLGGFHTGKTCGRDGFATVAETLIYMVLKDC
jgi:hypothetical protein